VAWASGSGGTVIRTIDAGKTWVVDTIPGVTKFDLRSIAALDDQTAVVAATAGRIWRTENGGKSWTLVYQNADTSVFLDAITFFDAAPGARERRGLVLGDPIDGRFFLLVTNDAGRTWHEAPKESRPASQPGEGAFAASGSSLVTLGVRHGWIGTGVNVARVLRTTDAGVTWTAIVTPLSSPSPSAGIFSLSFADSSYGIAIGGDYDKAEGRERTVAITRDGGATWQAPPGPTPNGFRSAVAFVPSSRGRVAVAVGTNGTDRSDDGGRTWTRVDTVGYHAVRFARDGSGWATGGRGRVARFAPDSTRLRP
ncbi:MAG: WD40/YVTN/BNR-like repeat-containing protein, partial [Gemmatimonadaceae bacterium]